MVFETSHWPAESKWIEKPANTPAAAIVYVLGSIAMGRPYEQGHA